MAFTVTATPGGASFQNGVNLLVRVLTNATESGGATSGSRNTAAGIPQGSLTPNFSSSWVGFAISQDGVGTLGAAAANNTYDDNYNNGTQGWCTGLGHYTGTVTASSALTYGAGASGTGGTGADHENWCAYEVPASGGTITIDGSSPAAVNNDTATSVTTASFTPPNGAVLVALVTAGGTGAGGGMTCTITDTAGLGLTWTQRAISSAADNFQPTFIFTASVPAGTVVKSVNPVTARPSKTWLRRYQHFTRPTIQAPLQQVAVHAGAAAVACAAQVSPPIIAGIGGSGYNSYFISQYGGPRLMLLEQAWALPWNAGRWNSGNWQSDYTAYFSARHSQGYNAWYGTAWGNSHVDSTALSGGRTWDGIYPLNVNGTPGAIATGSETITLNSSFWSRIDAFFATASQYGVNCFLNMSMSYDVSDVGGIWQHATNTQGTAFGAALAARYPQSSYPHVFWFWGDDDDGPNDSFYSAILSGMQGAGDARGLISIEQFTNTNCHIEFDNKTAFSGSFGAPNATYNWGYCYDAPYFGIEDSYAEGGTFTHIPPVYGDGLYYGDTGSGTNTDRAMRNFIWWALSSGARGIPSTSGPSDLGGGGLWTWQSGAVARLTSDPNGNGTWCTSVIGSIASYFSGLTDWHKLIPDTGNVFITAGRGTRGTCDVPGGAFNFRNTNNYVCGSVTPGGTLAVIYCKAAMSITIDQTKLSAGYTATWVDPASLATQSTATGSTYASAGLGNNSAGDPDWVLVLQGPAAASAPAAPAAVSVVAPAPSTAVTVNAGAAAVSVAAPAAPVADTVNAGVPAVLAAVTAPVGASTATAGAGVVLVADPGATVSTSSNTNAPAGAAAVSVAAPTASVADTAAPGAATVLVTAPQPVPAGTAAAGAPAVQAAAPAATTAESAFPGAAAIGAADPGATGSTGGGTTVSAGAAGVPAAAMAPSIVVTVNAGAAAIGAVAPGAVANTSSSTNAPAGVASVQAATVAPALALAGTATAQAALVAVTAPPPVPPLQQGASTPSVTDPRDGTASVAATATSSPGVS